MAPPLAAATLAPRGEQRANDIGEAVGGRQHQRGRAVAGPAVGGGASFEQQPHHLDLSARRGPHQRREAAPVDRVHRRTGGDQLLHAGELTELRRLDQIEAGRVAGVRAGACIRSSAREMAEKSMVATRRSRDPPHSSPRVETPGGANVPFSFTVLARWYDERR